MFQRRSRDHESNCLDFHIAGKIFHLKNDTDFLQFAYIKFVLQNIVVLAYSDSNLLMTSYVETAVFYLWQTMIA